MLVVGEKGDLGFFFALIFTRKCIFTNKRRTFYTYARSHAHPRAVAPNSLHYCRFLGEKTVLSRSLISSVFLPKWRFFSGVVGGTLSHFHPSAPSCLLIAPLPFYLYHSPSPLSSNFLERALKMFSKEATERETHRHTQRRREREKGEKQALMR